MSEVMSLSEDVKKVLNVSKEIVENCDQYKGIYQKYINAKRKNSLNKLKPWEKERGEKYEKFIEDIKNLINKHGFSEDSMKAFIEPCGIAEAIAATITFKPTQLRRIFHQIKTIKQEVKSADSLRSVEVSLIKILPLLAYSKGRGLISEDFYELSKALISKVRESLKKEDFDKFVDMFEAIVAYHRYYNPKES